MGKCEVKFSTYEKRVFELMGEKDFNSPESHALRKLVDVFPWLTTVAEYKFDSGIGTAALQMHAAQIQMQLAIEACQTKQQPVEQALASGGEGEV